jgi:maleylpyruvate isomerase
MNVAEEVAGAKVAHARLLTTLYGLGPGEAQQPSRLPAWNVAMVVTHLARNADSHSNVFEAAACGRVGRQYPNREQREAAIEAGRYRDTRQVVTDLSQAIERLEAWWDVASATGWGGSGLTTEGSEVPLADWPFQRWREVEIHHADLGLGYTCDDWDSRYVDRELRASLPYLAERLPVGSGAHLTVTDATDSDPVSWTVPADPDQTFVIDAPSRRMVAWLVGRETNGFPTIEPWQWRPRA